MAIPYTESTVKPLVRITAVKEPARVQLPHVHDEPRGEDEYQSEDDCRYHISSRPIPKVDVIEHMPVMKLTTSACGSHSNRNQKR